MVYFIADTHFSEKAIMQYENRPFESIEEMDKEMVSRWNHIVKKEDSVYLLGDLGADGKEASVLSQLNGDKYLVKGNHDTKSNQYYRDAGFCEVYDFPI